MAADCRWRAEREATRGGVLSLESVDGTETCEEGESPAASPLPQRLETHRKQHVGNSAVWKQNWLCGLFFWLS